MTTRGSDNEDTLRRSGSTRFERVHMNVDVIPTERWSYGVLWKNCGNESFGMVARMQKRYS